jgi:tripartite-type tricarboxylate transporter receptor subunit TctC
METVMNRIRRALLAGVLTAAAGIAPAQDKWPSKPIRIIVPFPPGGQTDIAARVVGQALSESLKAPVVIENKSGAHGFIACAEAARAPAYGYTLLVVSTGAAAINPELFERMPYDPSRDFAPVSLLMTVPIVIMANRQSLPVNTVQELVTFAKVSPGRVNFASSGSVVPRTS